jgi:hypothetical protein
MNITSYITPAVIEIAAWVIAIFTWLTIANLYSQRQDALEHLIGTAKGSNDKGAIAYDVARIRDTKHLFWLIPVALAATAFLIYRNFAIHPDASLAAATTTMKLVGAAVIAFFALVALSNTHHQIAKAKKEGRTTSGHSDLLVATLALSGFFIYIWRVFLI